MGRAEPYASIGDISKDAVSAETVARNGRVHAMKNHSGVDDPVSANY